MVIMKRLYYEVLKEHLEEHSQMIFLAGPRQVGKTTLVKELLKVKKNQDNCIYLNWDIPKDRRSILEAYAGNFEFINIDLETNDKFWIAFDEIHKFRYWKNFLKGFYDQHKDRANIIVTGSAKLNVYKKGSDSLMGRYLLYRMHPLSISETQGYTNLPMEEFRPPKQLALNKIEELLTFGGFPDPYLKKSKPFLTQWSRIRQEQFFKEEIRELSKVYEVAQIELLAELLTEQAGQLTNYTSLSKKIQVAANSVRSWIRILEEMYFCFRIKPYHKNISRALIKEPKIYLWDWSNIKDPGQRLENMVACHLLKAVHFWTDTGQGEYELYFVRDKEKNEVDFLLTKERKPWLLIEVKKSQKDPISKGFKHLEAQIKPEHAIQIAGDLSGKPTDIRNIKGTKIISLGGFLTQLL